MTVYIDESGYTGHDLLNREQPYQSVGALVADEVEAWKLIDHVFGRNKQMSELKYAAMARRPRNWDRILEALEVILKDFEGISYICNKQYMATLKFLDDCVEPYADKVGFNFYADGFNQKLAGEIFNLKNSQWAGQINNIVEAYQAAVKEKQNSGIDRLVKAVRQAENMPLAKYLKPVADRKIEFVSSILSDESTSDISLLMLLGLISKLEDRISRNYKIKHDTSKNMMKYGNHIKRLICINENREFPVSKFASIRFPLKLESVSYVDSKACAGVQLADLLAGSIVEAAKVLDGSKEANKFNQKILGLYGDNNLMFQPASTEVREIDKLFAGKDGGRLIEFLAKKGS